MEEFGAAAAGGHELDEFAISAAGGSLDLEIRLLPLGGRCRRGCRKIAVAGDCEASRREGKPPAGGSRKLAGGALFGRPRSGEGRS